jgi:peroxiredoxin
MATTNQTIDTRNFPTGTLIVGVAALLVIIVAAVLVVGSQGDAGTDEVAESSTLGPVDLPDNPQGLPVAPEVGALAPDFALQTPEGETLTLSDFRGQPVLVNYWATWCGPCRVEMPAIQAAYEAHKDDGFVVLAVNHTSTDSVPNIIEFREELDLKFPILVDEGSDVNKAYAVRAYPSSFFVDENGLIQAVHFGPITEGQLNENLDALLGS